MVMHLQKQIDRLKRMIIRLGAQVEQSFDQAMRALQTRDPELANTVAKADDAIDQMELEIEVECLHTLACDQPVAQDLRFIVSILKINNDLERIADLAVNIAEQAQFLSESTPLDPPPFDVAAQSKRVRAMLQRSLDALVNVNADHARWVCQTDDEVDEVHRALIQVVIGSVADRPHQAPQLIQYLTISRQLERIADHACNIAEDVIYMVEGEISRHPHLSNPES